MVYSTADDLHAHRCNRHLLDLGREIKASVSAADMIGYQFGTVGVSDGMSNGTSAMNYSLQSRDLIADQVETAVAGHWLDGIVVVPGCDKNMPGVLMARESSAHITIDHPFSAGSHSRATEPAILDGLRRVDTPRIMCWPAAAGYRVCVPVIWEVPPGW